MDMNETINSLVDKIKTSYKPEMIMIFGSMARGDVHPDSDLDLLIIKKTKKRPIQRRIDVRKILSTDMPVDVLVYTPDEFEALRQSGSAFLKTISKEGEVLYQRA